MFYERFEQLCREKGVTPNKACVEMGYSRSLAAKWKNTGNNPRAEVLTKVADYFGITVSELLGEEKEIASVQNGDEELNEYLNALKNDPHQRVLFNLVKNASLDEVKATVAFLRTLRHIDE